MPDAARSDPYFLACFLRSEANRHRASGTLGGTSRLDVRRTRVPRMPLSEQRRYGEAFRSLTAVTVEIGRFAALARERGPGGHPRSDLRRDHRR